MSSTTQANKKRKELIFFCMCLAGGLMIIMLAALYLGIWIEGIAPKEKIIQSSYLSDGTAIIVSVTTFKDGREDHCTSTLTPIKVSSRSISMALVKKECSPTIQQK